MTIGLKIPPESVSLSRFQSYREIGLTYYLVLASMWIMHTFSLVLHSPTLVRVIRMKDVRFTLMSIIALGANNTQLEIHSALQRIRIETFF